MLEYDIIAGKVFGTENQVRLKSSYQARESGRVLKRSLLLGFIAELQACNAVYKRCVTAERC